MANGNIDYNAVLADLEARKTQIDSAITAVKTILASAGVFTNGHSEGVIRPENIPSHAFLTLSIADAAKKYLDMVKSKQSLPQIMQALEKGGLPPAKYNTVYAVLRRREQQIGDIFRMGEDWALTEWYPNNPNIRKRLKDEPAVSKKRKPVKRGSKKSKTTIADKAAQVLSEAGAPMHLKDIKANLAELGTETSDASLRDFLTRKDKAGRFKALGKNMFTLADSPDGKKEPPPLQLT